jgi:branched-chain amino acid aminotransferase
LNSNHELSGQQAYEGLKAHRSPEDNILLFRPDKHATRMKHSTSVVSIPSIPETHFNACVSLAVSLNASFVPPSSSGGCLYIRPVVFGSSAHLGLTPPSEYLFCVYVQPFSTYHGVAPLDCLILEEFDRAAPFGTGNAKVGGNYAPVIRWTDQARKDGFPITLHLDSKTRSEVDEFSTSGFIGIHQNQDGKVTMVVPDSHNVIASVTSESCVELARSFGWTVEVRPVCDINSSPPLHCRITVLIFNPSRSSTMSSPPSQKSWLQALLQRSSRFDP